ncbi:unnamed protein product [Tilletia controversa]|uniref:Carboxylic ester hydrolase n=3 Tax=Tilletia TaxID=13289 RepID=A0A8X7MSA9_9BASI|nr:hypothetical protein CF336_g4299 [Tilletia laevis]KAE8196857.1 hypothetical protein CF328_g4017 [Tilletia controversa]KAE8261043.1 hypothetical protein A4X03_0g3590 [Tilletia caries]KAE8202245.1 hypothetical protein CF335_g3494 [Tilletia laevis]KAE8247070.1 hypothetical protein A4X06_0g4721 [Tilletia controversa]
MRVSFPLLAIFALTANSAVCANNTARKPVVKISQGTITGFTNTSTSVPVEAFLGIPYVLPPVRFARAKPVPAGYGDVDAGRFGVACTQNVTEPFVAVSEDCLTVNVFRPANVSADAKLPVAIFHYGGSFNAGGSLIYPGWTLIKDAVEARKPFVYVTLNYRVGMYGFAAGASLYEQVKKGNATLNPAYWDQREAQLWVAENIAAFGGDPKKVTIWGQSAGAFAVGAHLTLKDNQKAANRPFRAAILQSGTPQFPVTLPPTHPTLSAAYDNLLNYTGCSSTSSSKALACLRSVSASKFAAANLKVILNPAVSLGVVYTPPVRDGDFFPDSPNSLVRSGKFADVPILIGNMNDEGTLFAPTTRSGPAAFEKFARGFLQTNTTPSTQVNPVFQNLTKLYPDDLPQGSPYLNAPTKVSQGITNGSDPFFATPVKNQYKRLSSLLGDVTFSAQTRFFLQNLRSGGRSSPAWGYVVRQLDRTARTAAGCAHANDLPYLFGYTVAFSPTSQYEPLARMMRRAWVSFVVDLDPRTADGLRWPAYDGKAGKALFQFKGLNSTVVRDDFREEGMAFLTSSEAASVFSS